MVAQTALVQTPDQAKRQNLRDQLRVLALAIGLRPAARKLGINEQTATVWSHRYKWRIADCLSTHARTSRFPAKSNEVTAYAALEETLLEQSNDSKLYLSSAGLKASHEAAKSSGKALLTKEKSQALLNTARSLDVTHGWTAQRTAGPTVQIANVVMPTPEEKAERQAMFAKLEEITRRLAAPAVE